MANILGFIIQDYFFTGIIPYGADVPSKESISDARLTADCLEVCGIMELVIMPQIVQQTLDKAAQLLGMTWCEPILPVNGEGFMEYARRSGLDSTEPISKDSVEENETRERYAKSAWDKVKTKYEKLKQ